MTLTFRSIRVLVLLGALPFAPIGCGGGGGSDASAVPAANGLPDTAPAGPGAPVSGPPGTASPSDDASASNACGATFYRQLAGSWEGRVVYDATPVEGSACTWTVALEITTEGDEFTCRARATSVSSVTHDVVADVASLQARECLAGTSRFELLDAFGFDERPEPGTDFDYPVRMGWRNGLDPGVEPGPYFGDASVRRGYAQLFAGFEGDGAGADRQLEVFADRIEYVDRRPVLGQVRYRGAFVRPEPNEAP